MRLSTKTRNGTRILVDLAGFHNQGPVQVGDISKRQNISVKYLGQLIRPLKSGGLITSLRGPKGGHMLAKEPEDITLGEVVRIYEGYHESDQCTSGDERCFLVDTCKLRDAWQQATNVFFEILNITTIADLEGEYCKSIFHEKA